MLTKCGGLGTCAAEFAGQDCCGCPSAAAMLSADHPQGRGDLVVVRVTIKDAPSPTSRQGADSR